VQQLEDLTGEEVDVEEGAIATAFKKVAAEELEKLYPLSALAEAHHLPIVPLLGEYKQTLIGIQASTSDDCVRILTETGSIFGEMREKVRKLREVLTPTNLGTLQQARAATEQVWQRLSAHSASSQDAECVNDLKGLLTSEQFVESFDEIAAKTKTVLDAYRQAYLALFNRRGEAYQKAIEEIRNRPEWEPLAQTNQDLANSLLAPLIARVGADADRTAVERGTGLGIASLTEMESDLAAVEGLRSSALVKLQELSIGAGSRAPVRRIRIAEIFNRPIQTKEDLDSAIEQLRDSLQKFIDEGAAIVLE
jgi:hypothetical protein